MIVSGAGKNLFVWNPILCSTGNMLVSNVLVKRAVTLGVCQIGRSDLQCTIVISCDMGIISENLQRHLCGKDDGAHRFGDIACRLSFAWLQLLARCWMSAFVIQLTTLHTEGVRPPTAAYTSAGFYLF
eukprot:COSAG02_NODE_4630_length_5147_cov_1.750594_2_plen_128_part_00